MLVRKFASAAAHGREADLGSDEEPVALENGQLDVARLLVVGERNGLPGNANGSQQSGTKRADGLMI